jgi:hypothetical protein
MANVKSWIFSLVFIFEIVFLARASAAPHFQFATRLPTQGSQEILDESQAQPGSASDQRTDFKSLDFKTVPSLPSLSALNEAFIKIRDDREWRWDSMSDFPRRIPWLYLSDGCFLRAMMMDQKFKEWGYSQFPQLMIFGDLHVESAWGDYFWWFHVAPLATVDGKPYVLDPSVNPNGPTLLENWVSRMNVTLEDASFALCGPYTVFPDTNCHATDSDISDNDWKSMLQDYLGLEWNSLEGILGKPPTDLLGDRPPWLLKTY